jgi:hypothetical protein
MGAPSRPAIRAAIIVVAIGAVVYAALAHAADARAAEAIAPTFEDVQPRESAQATYAANVYTIVHVGGDTGKVNEPDSSWRPVRGAVYRISVEPDAYFASLGRPDLARAYASRRAFGSALVAAGYVGAAAGVVLVPWSLYKGHVWGAVAGGGLAVAGVLVRAAGEGMDRPELPEDRALDMAGRYDEALRAHLGLSVGGKF